MWTVAKKTLMVLPLAPAGQKQTSKPEQVNTLLRRASGMSANQLCCAYGECACPHMYSLAVWCAPHAWWVSTAGLCRPNGRLNEETGTAFIASSGKCILLSALHCFLEDEKGEEDEEISGVAVEEELARPRLASRKEEVKKSEIDLQLEDPAKLKRMIENDERLLRDRILRYTYWFCYKKVDQYVELKGSDFVAEHVRVECSVVSMQHGYEDTGSV